MFYEVKLEVVSGKIKSVVAIGSDAYYAELEREQKEYMIETLDTILDAVLDYPESGTITMNYFIAIVNNPDSADADREEARDILQRFFTALLDAVQNHNLSEADAQIAFEYIQKIQEALSN